MSHMRIGFGLCVLLIISSCAGRRDTRQAPATLRLFYQAALSDAKLPEADEISQNLVPIYPGNPDLIWNEAGQVLMVSWTKASFYESYSAGDEFGLYGDTWLTVAPFLQDFCSNWKGAQLNLRLAQMLGMPPERDYDTFVELWVDPKDLFRPCPDPEIADRECLTQIPLLNDQARSESDTPPWYCGPDPAQQAAAFVLVNPAHLAWMCSNWEKSFSAEDIYQQYPWTALGYTYDWGSGGPVGMSEFIAVKGASVRLERKLSTASFCGR